jgi:hypothetical protein
MLGRGGREGYNNMSFVVGEIGARAHFPQVFCS